MKAGLTGCIRGMRNGVPSFVCLLRMHLDRRGKESVSAGEVRSSVFRIHSVSLVLLVPLVSLVATLVIIFTQCVGSVGAHVPRVGKVEHNSFRRSSHVAASPGLLGKL